MRSRSAVIRAIAFCSVLAIAAAKCGGGYDSPTAPTPPSPPPSGGGQATTIAIVGDRGNAVVQPQPRDGCARSVAGVP